MPLPPSPVPATPIRLTARPLCDRCHPPLSTWTHACLGISPFNSHFSTAHITALARWALEAFETVHFFVPDAPSAYTFEAVGYPPERAAHKARRQANYVHNKICRALATLGVPDPAAMILDWQTLTANPAFTSLHQAVWEAFEGDAAFRDACLEASGWVLEGRLPAGTPASPEQLQIAVRYLLAELPLFTDTAAIVQQPASVFGYHQAPAFLQSFYQGAYCWKPADRQGFAVIQPARGPAVLAEGNPSGRVEADML